MINNWLSTAMWRSITNSSESAIFGSIYEFPTLTFTEGSDQRQEECVSFLLLFFIIQSFIYLNQSPDLY